LHDSTYPQRQASGGKTCPKCQGKFAFEPRERDPVTDLLFQNALAAVSANNRLRWGVEHLYYEVCRRARSRAWPVFLIVFVLFLSVMCFILAIVNKQDGLLVVGVIAGLAGIWAMYHRSNARFVRLDQSDFNRLWERWCYVHGTPEGVIVRQEQPARPPAAEPDLGDYSFDRAVICDRARTVDLLLANNFHFENNCAILSFEGYPPGPFETVRAMLKRNPRLEVFALHDATPAGCRLAHRLSTDPEWFAGQVKVTDVGLRPAHAGRFRGVLLRAKKLKTIAEGDGITAAEVQWLSCCALELAAVKPEQVLKRLFRAINRQPASPEAEAATAAGGTGVVCDATSFSTDAADAHRGVDAFG
jgi:hypothetical protein